eukprot:COSAG04_NODE_27405_length_283_cov_1.119565_1_plen_79_part_10
MAVERCLQSLEQHRCADSLLSWRDNELTHARGQERHHGGRGGAPDPATAACRAPAPARCAPASACSATASATAAACCAA